VKEFFEIFICSIKKNQQFHFEILSPHYNSVGIGMEFSQSTSMTQLKIFLAQKDSIDC
jgi:hypothetical protein